MFSPRAIVERNDISSRKVRRIAGCQRTALWFARRALRVNLNGLTFEVDVLKGHKTGLYLDQQVNYQNVAELAAGGRCSIASVSLAGFGLHAARAGAAHVHMLDQSADAIAAATAQRAGKRIRGQMHFRDRQCVRLAKGEHSRQAARKAGAAAGIRSSLIHRRLPATAPPCQMRFADTKKSICARSSC